MPEDTATLTRNLVIRVSDADLERIQRLKERLQAKHGPNVRVSQRTVLMEALDELEKRYDRLEGDRGRPR